MTLSKPDSLSLENVDLVLTKQESKYHYFALFFITVNGCLRLKRVSFLPQILEDLNKVITEYWRM
jgi:hypothetical protein